MAKPKMPKPTVVDFESFGIEGRPSYPPIPVGVSIKEWGKKARYYAWGHSTANNCQFNEAQKALAKAWANPDGVLFQNGKFDVDVAEVHMDMPRLDWSKYHDTMFLLYLDDPHQSEIGLKPSADRLLNMPQDEQDEVVDWLVANQPLKGRGIKISKSKASDHYAMRYLAYAPGDLVGRYADGDVIRTEKLFGLLWTKALRREMLTAYDRERRLMPILLEIERQGVPVDLKRLRADVESYRSWMVKIDDWIYKELKDHTVNLDSGAQLVAAMVAAKKVDTDLLPLTPTGKYKTDKESLMVAVKDKTLLTMLKYRTQLGTCLGTFMEPWLAVAEQSGGLIFTTWNQTKVERGGDNAGTRTGRLSSTPNFQNIPKEFKAIWFHEETDKVKAKKLAKCPLPGLPSLPMVRSYVVPFEGEVLIDRDYSQQEPRILAHFDGGALLQKYLDDPWVDFHDYAKEELEKMGKFYERKPVKNTNLGLIYGMGVGKLALRNEMPVDEASELKKAILTLYPGLKEMYREMKSRAASKLPIRTWGGREYYCEEPRVIDGRLVTFDYKMVNVLIQGSAADCTKEAIIRYWEAKDPADRLLLTVHDEILVSTPKKRVAPAMEILRQSMEGIEFDVPMLSEGSWTSDNWAALKDYDTKGKIHATH